MELVPKPEDTNKFEPLKSSTTLAQQPLPTTTSVNSIPAHVTLPPASLIQQKPIPPHVPVTPQLSNIPPIPITAHQQPIATLAQPTLTSRPPSSLPIAPITTSPANVEPSRYICCLLDNGVRCDQVAGNASFSARIQKIVATKKLNLTLDRSVRHTYICDKHKSILAVARALQHPVNLDILANQNRLTNNHTGAKIAFTHYPANHHNQVNFDQAGGDSVPSSSGGVDVDLQQLQVNTLRRYKRHFRVQTRPGLNKMQLAESLKSHFRTLPIIEKEAITYFVYTVKCYRNKLDNPKAD